VVVIVVMIVPMFVTVVAVIVAVVAVIVPMFITMVFTIVGNVSIGVPVMPDEVDRLPAGVVLTAVVAPIALVARAHMQIDRRRQHAALNAYANHGRAIDEARRRRVADIHASVKARVAQADGGGHLCARRAADCQRRKAQGEKYSFHVHLFKDFGYGSPVGQNRLLSWSDLCDNAQSNCRREMAGRVEAEFYRVTGVWDLIATRSNSPALTMLAFAMARSYH